MSRLIATYTWALKLLPATYRERYAEPMTQTLEDILADQPTQLAKSQAWLRALLDLPITAAHQYAQIGVTTMHQVPPYAKQSTLLGAVLLIPFFVLITLNAVHPLAASWKTVGYIGVFILPLIALAVGIATLGRLFVAKDLGTRLKSLKQIQHNWILFAVPLLALSIVCFAFGHDSAHCVTSNPVHALTNISRTMKCVTHS